MTRWPPILWPLMALASLLILMGLSIQDAEALIRGVIIALGVFGVAIHLATRHGDGRPRPRWSRGRSAASWCSSLPGIGMDSETPFGDTPEHSTAERVAQPDTRFRRERTRTGRH